MSNSRFTALDAARNRVTVSVIKHSEKISEFFGSNVFNKNAMREYLPEDVFTSLMNSIERGEKLDMGIADQVAAGMKNWAIAKGATHYTHWFQPLTGATAEKHDSFFHLSSDGRAMEAFSGSALVQQEPDASSFPNGGIRNTFEARGYTAWDPSSPAFLYESTAGITLCIPTIFVSYTGESLDYKAPLLKSLAYVEKAAVEVCHYFDRNITKVYPTLGVEQEYFLVDAALFNERPDLMMSGRTLIGHGSARGQQLEDHYFGSIPERVQAFMVDLENEAHKLGIPLKTRHNEVAPAQFECAPLFEEINLAVDHNQLLMDIMEKVGRRHNFRVLLHEKPFAGINGSGKHNNWSLATNTGKNLLSPSKNPKSNLQFLTFFVNTIKAFHVHGDLVRASIASASNDHRLGANEAPPAIMSAFLGSQLSSVLDEIEARKFENSESDTKALMKLGVEKLPEIMLDNTDRNRTSPFAFTGNKFELRAVGSSANSASAMTVLNTIVGAQLVEFKKEVDGLLAAGESKEAAIMKVIHRYIIESKAIRFEGNGYSDEWVEEAARRGLPNVKTTPHALDALVTEKAVKLFTQAGVYSERELHARHEIQLEAYTKKIQIEGRILGDMALTQIIPAAIRYQTEVLSNIQMQKNIGLPESAVAAQTGLVNNISTRVNTISGMVHDMVEARKKANNLNDAREMAIAYCEEVKPYFDQIRYEIDKLEQVIDDRYWPLPKYRELLFVK
jgi:glutamine synthetase